MQIVLCAIGKDTQTPTAALTAVYQKRLLRWPLQVKEIVIKSMGQIQEKEMRALEDAFIPGAYKIALDRMGKNVSSEDIATLLTEREQEGRPVMIFIGGADGFTPVFRQKMNLILSFGAATWPHMLARSMILEQLYRTQQIIQGHPYHRS